MGKRSKDMVKKSELTTEEKLIKLEQYFARLHKRIKDMFEPVWRVPHVSYPYVGYKQYQMLVDVYSKKFPNLLHRYFPDSIVEQLMDINVYSFRSSKNSVDDYIQLLNERYKTYLTDVLNYNENPDDISKFPEKVREILEPIFYDRGDEYGWVSKHHLNVEFKIFPEYLRSIFPESLVRELLNVNKLNFDDISEYIRVLMKICDEYYENAMETDVFIDEVLAPRKTSHTKTLDKQTSDNAEHASAEISKEDKSVQLKTAVFREAMRALRERNIRKKDPNREYNMMLSRIDMFRKRRNYEE